MGQPGPAERNRFRCAAAFSAHPDPAVAVGEVVGGVLDRLDPHPDVALVAMSGPQAAQLDEVVDAVRSLLAPEWIMGSTARAVFAGPQDLSGRGGLVLWACRGPGVQPVTLPVDQVGRAWSSSAVSPGDVVLLLASPAFEVGELAAAGRTDRSLTDDVLGALTTVVGVAAPARSAGVAARLVDGDGVVDAAAVGLALPGSAIRLFGLEVSDHEDQDELDKLDSPDALDSQPGTDGPGGVDGSAGDAGISAGAGALLLVDRSVPLSARWELEVDRALQRFSGTVAGIVGAGFSLGPGVSIGRGDPRRTSVLVVD